MNDYNKSLPDWVVFSILGLMAIGLIATVGEGASGAIGAAFAQPTPTATPITPEVLACRQAETALDASLDAQIPSTAPDAHEQLAARQAYTTILRARMKSACQGIPPGPNVRHSRAG